MPKLCSNEKGPVLWTHSVLIIVTVCMLIVIFPHANGFNESRIVLHVLFLALLHAVHLFLSCNLHWLPIEARVSYKLCCLMYRIVHGAAPSYLTELCEPCLDSRLRSTSRGDFIIPRSNRHLADSSFSVAGPSAWNQLPANIRNCSTLATFLTKLKAHLFTVSFSH